MDCDINVCSGCHNEKTAENWFDSLHYFTDFKYFSFWEKAYLSSADAKWLQKRNY